MNVNFFIFIHMKNKYIKIIIIAVILFFVLLLLISRLSSQKEESFKLIELPTNNSITNNVYPMYYDSVLLVAMNQMDIDGYSVVINKLSDISKNQFDGELKAHIRFHKGVFYLFADDFNRRESIEVLSHEVIHIQQYTSSDLIYEDGYVMWLGDLIELNSKEYEQRPWENDAFLRQTELIKKVEEILYND